ncbi:MAG: hypothetical protein IH628_05450, partial [Proteobacteria bacterium]|nr:hypothetical protein [Pseudomonadota bacterium]
AFVRSVTDRTPATVSGRDGRDALELALSINDAIDRNRARSPLLAPAAPPAGPYAESRTEP